VWLLRSGWTASTAVVGVGSGFMTRVPPARAGRATRAMSVI
jgi:hypothetical protein